MRGLWIVIPLILVFSLSLIKSTSSDDVIDGEVNDIIRKDLTAAEKPDAKKIPLWAGFVGCLVASVFFGLNLLPVKQFSAGDGFFFQFVFCVAVWLVGLILDRILDNQRFYPLVLIGGIRFHLLRFFF